jgi:protein-S-isoprenylcysteine O-methyltransferase Ste14
MYYFLIPLLSGFISNLASAFTSYYSEKWGEKTGTFVTILLRDIFGIPVWAFGFVMAIKESGKIFFYPSLVSQIAGWSIIAAGVAIIVTALIIIRIRAAAPTVNDKLVRTGIYSLVRHPIHCGTFLEFAGLLILWPSLNVALSFLLGTLWIYIQSLFEERDLLKRIPEYAEYKNKVRRFFPFPVKTKGTQKS